jgi:hypothetical protein
MYLPGFHQIQPKNKPLGKGSLYAAHPSARGAYMLRKSFVSVFIRLRVTARHHGEMLILWGQVIYFLIFITQIVEFFPDLCYSINLIGQTGEG